MAGILEMLMGGFTQPAAPTPRPPMTSPMSMQPPAPAMPAPGAPAVAPPMPALRPPQHQKMTQEQIIQRVREIARKAGFDDPTQNAEIMRQEQADYAKGALPWQQEMKSRPPVAGPSRIPAAPPQDKAAAIPPRPKNVPATSSFHTGWRVWMLPDGTMVDEYGNPRWSTSPPAS